MTIDVSTEEMWEMYDQGVSLKEVGARYGMTAQGVRLRFKTHGYQTRTRSDSAKLRRELGRPIKKLDEALQLWLTTNDSLLSIAEKVGLNLYQVTRHIHENTTKEARTERHRQFVSQRAGGQKYTDEELIEGIRAYGEFLGRTPGINAYSQFAKENGLASGLTITDRFVTWNDAVALAGFTPNTRPVKMGLPTFTNEDFESALCRVARSIGHRPSYDEYKRNYLPGEPTSDAFRKRYGSWINALDLLL
jgi:nucleotidyltransferase/DNA polymerase involved in DNA repair